MNSHQATATSLVNIKNSLFALGDENGDIEIYDPTSKEPITVLKSGSCVNALIYEESTGLLISGHADGCIHIWDFTTKDSKPIKTIGLKNESSPVTALALTPHINSVLISGHANGAVNAWKSGKQALKDGDRGRVNTNLENVSSKKDKKETDAVTALIFCPTTYEIACAHKDGNLRFWNLENHKNPYIVLKPGSETFDFFTDSKKLAREHSIHSLCVTSDQQIVCGLGNGKMKFLTATSSKHEVVKTIETHSDVQALLALPGNYVVSGHAKKLMIWDIDAVEATAYKASGTCIVKVRDQLIAVSKDGTFAMQMPKLKRQQNEESEESEEKILAPKQVSYIDKFGFHSSSVSTDYSSSTEYSKKDEKKKSDEGEFQTSEQDKDKEKDQENDQSPKNR